MIDAVIGLIVFACVLAGGMAGLLLSPMLPRQLRTRETRDAIRLGIGMISILASLVLGLLTASAKGTLDLAEQQIRAYAADLILLDQTLRLYGTTTDPIRKMVLTYTDQAVRTTWPEETFAARAPLEDKAAGELLSRAMAAIIALQPSNDDQRWLRVHALDIATRLVRTRWSLLLNQAGSLNPIMLGIVVFWVTLIFASFGLNAPRNALVIGAFAVCAISIGAAVFLIEEMDSPFDGLILVSGAAMKNALVHLSQ